MKQITFLSGFFFLLLFYGCKKDEIQVKFEISRFLEMKHSWEASGITSYSYNFSHNGCLCFAYHYVVSNNQVIKVDPDTSTCHNVGPYLTYTVDEIFSKLENLYNNPYVEKIDDETYIYCSEIRIKYDSIYFFPSYYEIFCDSKNMEIQCPHATETLTNFIK
jgi:hypothetical protein